MDGDRERDELELRELYNACYPRLVGVLGAMCGSQQDAEEAVQDAFVRLIGQWPRVRGYEDPEGWVRRVAIGKLSNQRRKARNGLRALIRLGPSRTADGPDGDTVDLARALAALPRAQREVLVLHHVVGLAVEAVAVELSAPVGTVKSRLRRGRLAAAALLGEHARA